ncbi:MAG TPA: CDP-alcohol phosphatidyltransferase family protein [Acidimicrobiales bacterium]|nr:CDP-alcohol phosphatidyltransferase family protein [Acidimicrobiales bacterium]
MTSTYSPDAIKTWANGVTVARVLVAPILFAMIANADGSWAALAVWFVLCASDGVDGWLARRHGVTRSGAFLDPLADKVLVLGAMFTLVRYDVFWIVPVLIIAAREVVISVYRTVAGRHGVSVPAKRLAKAKTLCQQLAVGIALCPILAHTRWLFNTFLWLAVVLTVITGAQYLIAARRVRTPPPPQVITAP